MIGSLIHLLNAFLGYVPDGGSMGTYVKRSRVMGTNKHFA